MEDEATNRNKFHDTWICIIHFPLKSRKNLWVLLYKCCKYWTDYCLSYLSGYALECLLFLMRGWENAIILFTWNVTSCSADKYSLIGNMVGFHDKTSKSIKLVTGTGSATNLNFNILICNFLADWESSVNKLSFNIGMRSLTPVSESVQI